MDSDIYLTSLTKTDIKTESSKSVTNFKSAYLNGSKDLYSITSQSRHESVFASGSLKTCKSEDAFTNRYNQCLNEDTSKIYGSKDFEDPNEIKFEIIEYATDSEDEIHSFPASSRFEESTQMDFGAEKIRLSKEYLLISRQYLANSGR